MSTQRYYLARFLGEKYLNLAATKNLLRQDFYNPWSEFLWTKSRGQDISDFVLRQYFARFLWTTSRAAHGALPERVEFDGISKDLDLVRRKDG